MRDFFKATETIIVLGGLSLSLLLGKFWIIPTALAYIIVNIPNLSKFIARHVGTRPDNPPKE